KNDYEDKLLNLNHEIRELKNIVLNLSENKISKEEFIPKLRNFHGIMVNNGVNPHIAASILKEVEEDINLDNKDNKTIRKIIKYILAEKLGSPKTINIDSK